MIKVPDYNDDEVRVFHPLYQNVFSSLIVDNKVLLDNYELIHHPKLPTGRIPDFILRNKYTKKTVLISELKRTKSDVFNYNFTQQVYGYAQDLKDNMEKNFYLLTNIELINLFKYDEKRQNALNQLLKNSPIKVAEFNSSDLDSLQKKLRTSLENILDNILSEQNIEWKVGLSQLSDCLRETYEDKSSWESVIYQPFIFYLFSFLVKQSLISYEDAIDCINNPDKLNSYLNSKVKYLNLSDFTSSEESDNDLNNASFNSGSEFEYGEDLAYIIQDIVMSKSSRETIGTMAPTDSELCLLLNFLAKNITTEELQEDQIIIDPSAGVGNILAETKKVFKNIKSNQIWANEIDFHFKEALFIRLFLNYYDPSSIDQPIITISDIKDLKKNQFENVKIVISNPPFGRRANEQNVETIKALSDNIESITGESVQLNFDNLGLECLHLEFIWSLLKDDSSYITIFPTRYLISVSKGSEEFRKFLINKFGVNTIIQYPHNSIFADVQKTTLILCGIKNKKANSIKFVNIQKPFEEINYDEFEKILNFNINDERVNVKDVSTADLENDISSGWKKHFYKTTFKDILSDEKVKLVSIDEDFKFLPRGNAGNKGGSDLIFPDINNKIVKKYIDLIPGKYKYLGIRHSTNIPLFINPANYTKLAIKLDEKLTTKNKNNLTKFFKIFDQKIIKKNGVQYKKAKTIQEKFHILESSRLYSANTLVIPRAIRKEAGISMLEDNTILSTNFVPIFPKLDNSEISLLTLSWLVSVFGQVQFEEVSNNEDGLRKIEINNVKKLLIPEYNKMDKNTKEKIINILNENANTLIKDFSKPQTPQLNALDVAWAVYLFGNDYDAKLNDITNLLEILVDNRIN